MKNLLLLTVFVCSVFFADAQFSTGQKLISGQFGISFAENTINSSPGITGNAFLVNFSPSFAKFKSPQVIDGVGLSYFYSRYRTGIGTGSSERIQPSHSFGLFVNRTKLEPLARKFYFTYTGTTRVFYSFSHPYYISGASDSRQDYFGVQISGGFGLLYQLNQRFLLTWDLSNVFTLGYQHGIETGYSGANVSYKNISNRVDLTSNLANINLGNVVVGVRYMLKK